MSNRHQHEVNPPTQAEIDSWDIEFSHLAFPDFGRPPVDAWDYMLADFKRVRRIHQRAQIKPDEKYSLRAVSFSFFTWLATKDGTEWLFDLFGVEEVKPHHGYRYWFGGKPHTAEGTLIGSETDSSLRIYLKNPMNRFAETPFDKDNAVEEMKRIMTSVYEFRDRKEPLFPSQGIWKYLLAALRNWFVEPVDKQWPHSKPDRISGVQWAQQRPDPERPDSLMWSAITETEKYKPRTYRVEQRGGVLWCGRTHIYAEPLDSFMYKEGVKAIRDGQVRYGENRLAEIIQDDFRCQSCDSVICCVSKVTGPQKSVEKLCDNCFGSQDGGSQDVLDNCTYAECFQCPSYIRTSDDLKNLKRTLEQDYQFPIRR